MTNVFAWKQLLSYAIPFLSPLITECWAKPQLAFTFLNGSITATTTLSTSGSLQDNSTSGCDCAVIAQSHFPIPGWDSAPTSTPVATIAVTINNATHETTSSFLPNSYILATDIGGGVLAATLTITQTTAVSPFQSTIFTTVITSPSIYGYTDYFLEVISETPTIGASQQTVCDTRTPRPSFVLPWTPPAEMSGLDIHPYTTSYPSLATCNGFPRPSGAIINQGDIGAQPALIGGVTITQLSYIYDAGPGALGDMAPAPNSASPNSLDTQAKPPAPSDTQATPPAPVLPRPLSPTPQPPSSPSASEPSQTSAPQQPEAPPEGTGQPNQNPPRPQVPAPLAETEPQPPTSAPLIPGNVNTTPAPDRPQQTLITLLSQTLTLAPASGPISGAIVIGSQTLIPGSSILLSGIPVSISVSVQQGSSGGVSFSNVIIGSSTIALPPSPTPPTEPEEIITLPGGLTATANSEGNFLISGSTYTPTSGTVEIVGGGSTASVPVVTETRGAASGAATESLPPAFTGAATGVKGSLKNSWRFGVAYGVLAALGGWMM